MGTLSHPRTASPVRRRSLGAGGAPSGPAPGANSPQVQRGFFPVSRFLGPLENSYRSGDTDPAERAERHRRDREMVHSVLKRRPDAVVQFIDRMGCVPRFLSSRNARMGRPLSQTELQDVTQEVLTIVWRKLASFEGKSSLETWVYRICAFEFSNALRRHRRRETGVTHDEEVLLQVPEETAEPVGDVEALREELDRLQDDEADIIRLKHYDDLTFAEIGERLGLSDNTAKTRYYRGLRRLKDALSRRGGIDQ